MPGEKGEVEVPQSDESRDESEDELRETAEVAKGTDKNTSDVTKVFLTRPTRFARLFHKSLYKVRANMTKIAEIKSR